MVVTQPERYAILFAVCIGILCAATSEGSKGNTTVLVFVHRRTGSKPCELVQRGSFVTAKEFAWVEIEGENSETYSPEMGSDDYLSASPPVRDADCPGLPSAISEVEQAQALRRAALQARTYMVGTDDIMAASPLNEKESGPKSEQSTAPNNRTDGTEAKTKKKFHGTVVLNILIGTEGTVQQSQVVRSSLNLALDKKAAEVVSRWKFTPARKKGLPVSSVMPVEVTFNLQ